MKITNDFHNCTPQNDSFEPENCVPLTAHFHILGLIRLQDLVRSPPAKNMEVYIRQATKHSYRKILREIKKRNIGNIIVDTNTEHVDSFFRAVSHLIC